MVCLFLSLLPFCIWIYLLCARGNFWREKPQALPFVPVPATPAIAIVIPARNEEEGIGRCLTALLRQDYQGAYRIFVMDDHSEDATPFIAQQTAEKLGQSTRLEVIAVPSLPADWGGKLWAMQTGVEAVKKLMPEASYILFTDADIEHAPDSVRELVTRAEAGKFTLTSFMVRLNCKTRAEKFLIPAFVYFFMMLYPFGWARDPENKMAAAAGGAMLVKRTALDAMGGLAVMKDALIDDCTLARHMKKQGPIWLGLSEATVSLREYPKLADIWNMIARTAYTQLNYSPLLLLGCVAGMGLTFLAPIAAIFLCPFPTALLGALTWGLMALSYAPMLRFYQLPLWQAFWLPGIALIYLLTTLDSARRHLMGKGGQWKGRVRKSS